jgi:hypothetical protein
MFRSQAMSALKFNSKALSRGRAKWKENHLPKQKCYGKLFVDTNEYILGNDKWIYKGI